MQPTSLTQLKLMASSVLSLVGEKREATKGHPGLPLLKCHCVFTGDGDRELFPHRPSKTMLDFEYGFYSSL